MRCSLYKRCIFVASSYHSGEYTIYQWLGVTHFVYTNTTKIYMRHSKSNLKFSIKMYAAHHGDMIKLKGGSALQMKNIYEIDPVFVLWIFHSFWRTPINFHVIQVKILFFRMKMNTKIAAGFSVEHFTSLYFANDGSFYLCLNSSFSIFLIAINKAFLDFIRDVLFHH